MPSLDITLNINGQPVPDDQFWDVIGLLTNAKPASENFATARAIALQQKRRAEERLAEAYQGSGGPSIVRETATPPTAEERHDIEQQLLRHSGSLSVIGREADGADTAPPAPHVDPPGPDPHRVTNQIVPPRKTASEKPEVADRLPISATRSADASRENVAKAWHDILDTPPVDDVGLADWLAKLFAGEGEAAEQFAFLLGQITARPGNRLKEQPLVNHVLEAVKRELKLNIRAGQSIGSQRRAMSAALKSLVDICASGDANPLQVLITAIGDYAGLNEEANDLDVEGDWAASPFSKWPEPETSKT